MLCLSEEELSEITSRKQSAAQRRWLTQQGWTFAVAADGSPKVLRTHAEAKLGAPKERRRRAPRLDGLASA